MHFSHCPTYFMALVNEFLLHPNYKKLTKHEKCNSIHENVGVETEIFAAAAILHKKGLFLVRGKRNVRMNVARHVMRSNI